MITMTRWAYCHACGDAVDCNEHGCIPCQERRERKRKRSRLARIALAGMFFWAALVRDGKAMAS